MPSLQLCSNGNPTIIGARLHSALFSLVLGLCLTVSAAGCFQTPQVGDDDRVYRELDALYTAVTARRTDLVDECRQRLATLHADRAVTDATLKTLNQIAETGRGGNWESSAKQLHRFIRAQKRPGGPAH